MMAAQSLENAFHLFIFLQRRYRSMISPPNTDHILILSHRAASFLEIMTVCCVLYLRHLTAVKTNLHRARLLLQVVCTRDSTHLRIRPAKPNLRRTPTILVYMYDILVCRATSPCGQVCQQHEPTVIIHRIRQQKCDESCVNLTKTACIYILVHSSRITRSIIQRFKFSLLLLQRPHRNL